MAAIGLGLLQMLSLQYAEQIWAQLPLWFRTLRKEAGPSEHVVRATLQAEMDRIFGSSRARCWRKSSPPEPKQLFRLTRSSWRAENFPLTRL